MKRTVAALSALVVLSPVAGHAATRTDPPRLVGGRVQRRAGLGRVTDPIYVTAAQAATAMLDPAVTRQAVERWVRRGWLIPHHVERGAGRPAAVYALTDLWAAQKRADQASRARPPRI